VRSKKQSDNSRAKYRKNNDPAKAMAGAKSKPNASQNPPPTATATDKNKKETSSPKKGCRIPADFIPDLDAAVSLGVPMQMARVEAEKFRDYWTAATGQNATKLDWPATWRNWCRNAAKRFPARGSPGGGSKSAFREHQDAVTASLERSLHGTEFDPRNDDKRQPAFDLDRSAFRRE
jgi:hypothetical protein